MLLKLITLLNLIVLLLSLQTGYVSHYDEGVMNATVQVRQEWGQLPQDLSEYDGFIAVLDCKRIGENFILIDETGIYNLLITDCAVRDDSDGTRTWMLENNIVGEVDYYTAQKLNSIGGGKKIKYLPFAE